MVNTKLVILKLVSIAMCYWHTPLDCAPEDVTHLD